jgi:hypothetical protein
MSPAMQSRTAIGSFVLVVAACGGRSGVDPLDYDAGASGGTGGSAADAKIDSRADARIDVAGLTCSQQTSLASSHVSDIVTEAQKDLSCATADDCMNVEIATSCTAGCTAYVNVTGGKRVIATIADINDTICSGFAAKGCMIAVPPCVPVLAPGCLNGKCTPFR